VGEANREYGKSVGTALKIVRQLHWDTMRLLTDFDGLMVGWKSVFGNTVTGALATVLPHGFWMAEGVYRYYVSPTEPGKVHGVTIAFEDYSRRVDEPLLLAARIAYYIEQGQEMAAACKAWDIWELFFDKSEKRELGRVMKNYQDAYPQRVKRAGLIAVPLYSIESVAAAYELFNKVGELT
jgi:hypothetical protein